MRKIFTLLLLAFSLLSSAKTDGLDDDKIVTCPTASISYAGNPICTSTPSQPVTLTGTEGYLGGIFSASPVGLTINSVTGEIIPTSSVPGTYIIIYSIPPSETCAGIVVTTIVTLEAQPTISSGSPNRTVCPNAAMMTINFTVTGATGATVTGLPTGVIGQYAANTFTISGTPTVAGTFNYTVTTTGGCSPDIAGGTITVDAPMVTLNSVNICQGDIGTIIATPSTSGTYTYSWTVPSGVTNPGNVASFATSVPGTYSVTIASGGCGSATATGTLTVNPIPLAIASPYSQTICSGIAPNISLSSNVPNTTYAWTVMPNGVFGASAGSGNTINQTLTTTGLSSGTVEYIITPVVNGCYGVPITIMVIVNPVPNILVSASGGSICSGETAPITITSINPNTYYTWNVVQNGVTGATSGSSTGSVVTIADVLVTTGNTQGTATYTIVPILNGCTGNPVTVAVLVTPLPEPTIQDGYYCVDGNGNVLSSYVLDTGLSDANHTFSWFFNSVAISSTGSTYEATTPGQYSVIAVNNTGCVSNVVIVNVIASEGAQSMSVTPSEQPDGNYTIDVDVVGSGNFLYQLDDGSIQSSNIFTDVPYGQHTIHVSDVNGCSDLITNIDLPEIIPQDFTAGPNPVTDILTLRNGQTINKVTIFNQVGQTVFEQEYNSKTVQMNLSALNAGIYFISMDANSNQRTKIVKN